ncbi:N-acetylmuramoyl-L-alanine amidase [Clostridium botulinum]|uniref:N-acetylmuramoyl-L-alanine amidase n=1 Tax=Clostridium botulinum TaxID=1491 RepID=UPI00249360DC|nr:N-acetylmuramoyl-L-alanine amidase [Clostridium botulinum]BDB00695.1 hypothetical protein CBOS2020_07690 [Clostridium botulinum]
MNIFNVNLRFNNLGRYNNPPKSLVVHHTECNGWTIEMLNEFHRDEKGWAGIGYHYYISKDGQIFKGRPDDSQGAHVSDYNKNSLGIAFQRNYDKDDKEMPKEQFNAWCELKSYLTNKYGDIFFNVRKSLEKIPNDVDIFPTTNSHGPWFETNYLPIDRCKKVAKILGN